MDKQEIIKGLEGFNGRLHTEIFQAYEQRGNAFGWDRFQTWSRKLSQFLDQELPGESKRLKDKLKPPVALVSIVGESDANAFWREYGDKIASYIESLILDIRNDEYDLPKLVEKDIPKLKDKSSVNIDRNKIFIIHGHDGEAKERTARFITQLGFEPIILNEQANCGLTIIEKIEKYTDVGFAIALYTPDDKGNTENGTEKGKLKSRARQNVVFEHGFLIGRIGRNNVVTLVADDIELPSDISGVVYISDKNWQIDIAKEMKAAGYTVDFNKLL